MSSGWRRAVAYILLYRMPEANEGRLIVKSAAKIAPLCFLVFMLSILPGVQAQSNSAGCGLAARLQIGLRAMVVPGNVMNLRVQPGTASSISAQISSSAVFVVLGGPRCAGGFTWWQVDLNGLMGWMAEGDPQSGEYWLAPFTPLLEPENEISHIDALGIEHCKQPPEDYSRVLLGSAELNGRTLAMLDYAQTLYRAQGGTQVDFRLAITQGSYTGGYVAASLGTHDGGGALDLSVRSALDFSVLTNDIPLMLRALRVAGFAAWLREVDELYPGSPIHIHAVAIGDRELSEAARAQIDGPYGYLRGYNGLPGSDGIPQPDRSGEMVICPWMEAPGFSDLRQS